MKNKFCIREERLFYSERVLKRKIMLDKVAGLGDGSVGKMSPHLDRSLRPLHLHEPSRGRYNLSIGRRIG